MYGPAYGFTVMLADEDAEQGPTRDFIVSDEGVLYATTDHGANWRCLGVVDPVSFLTDNGCPAAAASVLDARPSELKYRA
jgi:photosystem II stability/assembly factor-like uncharacterized protein